MTHTPGPWIAQEYTGQFEIIGKGRRVASVPISHAFTGPEYEYPIDDARLITAVLDLLVALKLYRESHNCCIEGTPQGRCNKCQRADAAIAKAEGKA